MNFEQARFNMIEQQIRPWNVLEANVLDLLSKVRREDFVPAAHQALAFADLELPLTAAGDTGPCMLAPRLEARMVQDLALQPHEKVLEIGTGSGYTAALMAQQSQRVITLEIDANVAQLARNNLSKAGIGNVEVRVADGAQGASVDGPFDAIVLSGSVAEVPHALLEQLKVGGRLIAIVGDEPIMRATLIQRTSATEFSTRQPWDANAPRLRNFAEHAQFKF
jgi:protein-L-isoaspartate(D-aspartate) O-methyltransferase